MRQRRVDPTETSSTPSERCRTLTKGGQKHISSPSALTPVVATQTLVGWAPTLPPPLDAATTDHSRKAHRSRHPPQNLCNLERIGNLDWSPLETWTGPHLEISDHCRCNVEVAFPHHIQTVSQLAKWAAVRTRWALASPKPPLEKDKEARTCASTGAEGVPRMVQRHLHTALS